MIAVGITFDCVHYSVFVCVAVWWLCVCMLCDQQREPLTGVQLEEKLDRVVVQVAAVQDHLDERSKPTLPCRRHGH